jgi:hypothetical protein
MVQAPAPDAGLQLGGDDDAGRGLQALGSLAGAGQGVGGLAGGGGGEVETVWV